MSAEHETYYGYCGLPEDLVELVEAHVDRNGAGWLATIKSLGNEFSSWFTIKSEAIQWVKANFKTLTDRYMESLV